MEKRAFGEGGALLGNGGLSGFRRSRRPRRASHEEALLQYGSHFRSRSVVTSAGDAAIGLSARSVLLFASLWRENIAKALIADLVTHSIFFPSALA